MTTNKKTDAAGTKVRQIADSILAAIASGHLRSGDRVASERKLTEQFGVSLGTAQRALQELEHRGVLTREHGRGSFVRGLGASVDARYVRFRDSQDRDLPVFWHMLTHCKARPVGALARFFGKDLPLTRIDRQVDVDGRFVLISQFFLPEQAFQALSAELRDSTNLRELISQRLALPTLRVEQLVGFEPMPAAVARALSCEPGQWCFALELRGYTTGDQPIYLQRIYGELFENATLVVDTNR